VGEMKPITRTGRVLNYVLIAAVAWLALLLLRLPRPSAPADPASGPTSPPKAEPVERQRSAGTDETGHKRQQAVAQWNLTEMRLRDAILNGSAAHDATLQANAPDYATYVADYVIVHEGTEFTVEQIEDVFNDIVSSNPKIAANSDLLLKALYVALIKQAVQLWEESPDGRATLRSPYTVPLGLFIFFHVPYVEL